MCRKRRAFRAGHRHLAWPCCCPEQTLGSPRVAVETCLGTPGPDRSVATEVNKTQFGFSSPLGRNTINYNSCCHTSAVKVRYSHRSMSLDHVLRIIFFTIAQ